MDVNSCSEALLHQDIIDLVVVFPIWAVPCPSSDLYRQVVNFRQFDLVCGPIFEIRCFEQVTAASGNRLSYARPL